MDLLEEEENGLSKEEQNHPKFLFFKDGTLDLSKDKRTIEEEEYYEFQTIKNVIFGSYIKRIEGGAFLHCFNLQEVDFNGTCITQIPNRCFAQTSLKNILLPSSISVIMDSSFLGCKTLSSIVLLGVKQIYAYAFSECPNLTNIELSDLIEYIHPNAFSISEHDRPITITCPVHFDAYFLERFPNATFARNA